jgi:potassium uptake TrkH family protein
MLNATRKIRENIKLLIWDYIPLVKSVTEKSFFTVVLLAIGTIIYYHGFPQSEQSAMVCRYVIQISLLFFSFKYGVLAFFNVHTLRYFKSHKMEGLLAIGILLWHVSVYLFHINFLHCVFGKQGGENVSDIALILIQLYFLLTLKISFVRDFFDKIKIKPGGLLILSFLVLIVSGTLLLMMPEMTTEGISWTDAMFTATSASCVTGLSSVDAATAFTSKGLFTILLLIQLGGINIICFASFLSNFYTGRSLRYQSVLKEMFNTSLEGTRNFMREIIMFSLLFEIIGFVLIFVYLNITSCYSFSWEDNAFLSAFHAIASFNNAGFSFLPDGMMHVISLKSFYLQTVTMVLMLLGGLGFLTIHDVIYAIRRKKRWYNLHTTSRIVLKMTLILILVGAVSFFVLEYNTSCRGMSLWQRIYTSLFSSITCRTAGFNTVDFGQIRTSTLLLITFFMIIGAAPGSTGGGIKVTTFYLLLKTVIATILGKQQVSVLHRAVSFDLVNKSYAVLILAIMIVFLGTFVLTLTEPFDLKNILFEVASAFGTTGLSTGITGSLSDFAKMILVIIMYLGRITVLTFAFSVTRKVFTRYSLAKTDVGI